MSDGSILATGWLIRLQPPFPGTYTVSYRVASPNGSQIQFERAGGGAIFGTISVPATGGWQTWTTVSHDVVLSSSEQQIALAFPTTGGLNINWFTITRSNRFYKQYYPIRLLKTTLLEVRIMPEQYDNSST